MANVTAVADDTFEHEVLKSSTPVLIDFWAPWCAPCRAIAPIVEELSATYAGKLKVVKMNVDDNPKTPSRYGVRFDALKDETVEKLRRFVARGATA